MNIKDFVKAKEKINEQFKKGQITKEQRSNALKKLREARSAARAGRLSKTPIGKFINYLTGSKPLSSVVDKKAATTRAAVSNLSTKKAAQFTPKKYGEASQGRPFTKTATKKAGPDAPPSRPTPSKRKSKNTPMSKGNTLAGSSGRRSSKGPGVGKTDKTDPRKNFASKATTVSKKIGPTPKRKSKDKNDPRGNQIKAISSLPAGALRRFQGKYNNKKEKLRNIGGKTFVFKK